MNVASPVNAPQRICLSCDHEPPADRSIQTCPACGGSLLELREPVDPLIGQVVDGRFEIRDRLGKGGMGTVYRGWQRSIGREVAVKLIDSHHSGDPMAVRRFMREARLASQLSQPNTVSVLDFGQASDGRLFIAMELVRGRTLAAVLEQDGPFPLGRVARVGIQLCDALDAAHMLEILHRDLKPPNIIVLDDPPGRDLIKVLDFGLAKSLRDEETHSTEAGFVVGTPHYMAPEVIAGLKPSIASDLYSVGVILAELFTGTDVWKAESTGQLVVQKGKGLPRELDISGPLRPLLEELLSPEPQQRPASASELREALLGMADALDSVTATATPGTGPRTSRPGKLRTPTPLGAELRPTTPGRAQQYSTRRLPGVEAPPRRPRKMLGVMGGVALAAIVAIVGIRTWRTSHATSGSSAEEAIRSAVEHVGSASASGAHAPRSDGPASSGAPAAPTAFAAHDGRGAAGGGDVQDGPGAARDGTAASRDGVTSTGEHRDAARPAAAQPAVASHGTQAAHAVTAARDTAGAGSGAAAQVTLHIVSRPSAATVRMNGAELGPTPLDLQVTKGTRVRLELTLAGTTVRRSLRPDRDEELLVVLPTHHAPPTSSSRHDALPF